MEGESYRNEILIARLPIEDQVLILKHDELGAWWD